VIVRVWLLKPETRAKMVDGKEVTYESWSWMDGKPLVLDQTVRAYRTDGKAASPADVQKALAKPTGVACFVNYSDPPAPAPDPFYLATLRAGSVVLAFKMKDVSPPPVATTPLPKTKEPPKKTLTKEERPAKVKELLAAAANGKYERIAELIGEGLGIDEQNEEGQTALMQAAANGHNGLAEELLVKYKANPKLKNKAGQTAEQLARSGGHDATAAVIAKHTK
jgi:hypothetical protein